MQVEPFILNEKKGPCGIVRDLVHYIIFSSWIGKCLLEIRLEDIQLTKVEHHEVRLKEDSIVYGVTYPAGPKPWHRLKMAKFIFILKDDTGMVLKKIKKRVFRGQRFKIRPFHNELYTLPPGRKLILQVEAEVYKIVEGAAYSLLL